MPVSQTAMILGPGSPRERTDGCIHIITRIGGGVKCMTQTLRFCRTARVCTGALPIVANDAYIRLGLRCHGFRGRGAPKHRPPAQRGLVHISDAGPRATTPSVCPGFRFPASHPLVLLHPTNCAIIPPRIPPRKKPRGLAEPEAVARVRSEHLGGAKHIMRARPAHVDELSCLIGQISCRFRRHLAYGRTTVMQKSSVEACISPLFTISRALQVTSIPALATVKERGLV